MPINSAVYIHNLVICSNVFVRKDNKYLLIKRSPHKKYVPNLIHPIGGKVERNENPYKAAKREVMEEAGIKVKNMRLEAVFLEIKPVFTLKENWLIFHFSADYKSGQLLKTNEGKLVFLTKKELKQQKLFPSLQIVINNILNPKDGTVFLTVKYDKDGSIIEKSQQIDICAV